VLGLIAVPGAAALLLALDDARSMPAGAKLGVQIGLAAIAVWGFGFLVDYVSLPGLGLRHLGWLAVPVTLAWLVGMQNTVNLMDGVDGLAAGVVAIVAAALLLAAVSHGQREVVAASAALVGACLAFLVFNFNPASIIMGDSGSHFLGVALAMVAVVGIAKVTVVLALFVPVLALLIPIADTAWAILRRRMRRVSVATPDAEHLHHRLLRLGLSQRETCAAFYLTTAVCSSVGLMLFGHRKVLGVVAVLALVGLSTLVGTHIERTHPQAIEGRGMGLDAL
jgi:UDP-GlcNAc:undecaprenyl-phosphate GlcNAc-1-phosphate transferase